MNNENLVGVGAFTINDAGYREGFSWGGTNAYVYVSPLDNSNGDGYMTVSELSSFIFSKVVNYSKGAQHPQYGKIRNPNLDKGDFVFMAAGQETTLTSSSSSSLIEFELKKLAEEKERLERERLELEKFKSIAKQRQQLEIERANLAHQKKQLQLEESPQNVNQEIKKEQIIQENTSKQKLDEIEKLKEQLANLGIVETQKVIQLFNR